MEKFPDLAIFIKREEDKINKDTIKILNFYKDKFLNMLEGVKLDQQGK